MTGPVSWLAHFAAHTPNAPFIGTPGGWVTYDQMQARVERARGLLASAGVRPGTRVVLALPNLVATVVGWLALQSLGATTVELDREWGQDALAQAVGQAKPVLALISGRDSRKWLTLSVARVVVVQSGQVPEALRALWGERCAGWLSEEGLTEAAELPSRGVSAAPPPEVAQIVFTSGSTSAPRGVLQTTQNLCASTDGIAESLALTQADRAMLVLPLFYVYGKSVLLSHLRVGGSVFLDHRFMYPRLVMAAMGDERCTNFAGVPLTFESLRRRVDLSAIDCSSLRFVTQAGGAMQPQTIAWTRAAFAPAQLYVMYGQTEATSRLSFLPPALASEKQGSVGRGMPGVELRVVDDQGQPVGAGVEGQLIARGEVVMRGYLDSPEETARVLREGWLWTGDLARCDEDGFVYLTGRAKQVLKLGGHRVSPAELEHALISRAGVREAVVVGAPDGLEGEVAIAFVISDDVQLDSGVLLRHCRAVLPPPRVPRRVVLVHDFPRSTSGKVLLGELQRRAAELHSAERP